MSSKPTPDYSLESKDLHRSAVNPILDPVADQAFRELIIERNFPTEEYAVAAFSPIQNTDLLRRVYALAVTNRNNRICAGGCEETLQQDQQVIDVYKFRAAEGKWRQFVDRSCFYSLVVPDLVKIQFVPVERALHTIQRRQFRSRPHRTK